MKKMALIMVGALVSGCATRDSLEVLQERVRGLEARIAQNEMNDGNTHSSLNQLTGEVEKIASIRSDVNDLHSETNRGFKLIASKLNEIKKQMRGFQVARPRSTAPAVTNNPPVLRD